MIYVLQLIFLKPDGVYIAIAKFKIQLAAVETALPLCEILLSPQISEQYTQIPTPQVEAN